MNTSTVVHVTHTRPVRLDKRTVFVAWCECAWHGQRRTSLTTAMRDARLHGDGARFKDPDEPCPCGIGPEHLDHQPRFIPKATITLPRDIVEGLLAARWCNVCTGQSPSWDGHDANPPCVGYSRQKAQEALDA